jgi:hypothetical protein
MKLVLLLTAIMLSSLAHASLEISCESTNQWENDTAQPKLPLKADEVWKLYFKGKGDHNRDNTETYEIVMTKLKNKKVVEGPYSLKSILRIDDSEREYSYLSFSNPISTHPFESGRFTVKHLSKPYEASDPFVMYGWSKSPSITSSAMFYICKVMNVF